MFSSRTLGELETRRQSLITAAADHRARLHDEWSRLADSLGWADRAVHWARGVRPVLWIAAPVAGYAVARRGRVLLRWLPLIWPWWRIAKSFAARFQPPH
ncbi:MAG TPA: hypothetical protein PK640_06855 [Verrucomicrobiota bacterium]|nr:hypothetical protein [Verrucomicrobiota bacterium]